jgi:hypothetical protein
MSYCETCGCDGRAAEAEVERLRRIAGENYMDLLDQMDRSWGNASEVSRLEINAFIESRIVHKPTASLREALRRVVEKLEAIKSLESPDPVSHALTIHRLATKALLFAKGVMGE